MLLGVALLGGLPGGAESAPGKCKLVRKDVVYRGWGSIDSAVATGDVLVLLLPGAERVVV